MLIWLILGEHKQANYGLEFRQPGYRIIQRKHKRPTFSRGFKKSGRAQALSKQECFSPSQALIQETASRSLMNQMHHRFVAGSTSMPQPPTEYR